MAEPRTHLAAALVPKALTKLKHGWVVGDEPFVAYEFDTTTAGTYARPS